MPFVNKKVFLRDRKRHTTCGISRPQHVVSGGGGTPCAGSVKEGYPCAGPDWVSPSPRKDLGPETGVPPSPEETWDQKRVTLP